MNDYDAYTKAHVYRCDGDDTDCNPDSAHWIAVCRAGHVSTWASWSRAMLRATKGY